MVSLFASHIQKGHLAGRGMSSTNPDRYNRSYRRLHDLKGRTFVEADYPSRDPATCYGCCRVFGLHDHLTVRQGFVTSAENEPKREFSRQRPSPSANKQVFWICPSCFGEFKTDFDFKVSTSLRLEDVLDGQALGPAIGDDDFRR